MLKHLAVRNFALVDAIDIEFAPGLTVITGESGAGKSILLNALELVLGRRAAAHVIGPGAAPCEVVGDFEVERDSGPWRYLQEHELLDAMVPRRCLVRRTVGNGRSRAFVNGTPVNVGALQALCGPLVDVYAQQEHRSLLSHSVQLTLLDDYANAGEEAQTVREAYRAWQVAREELEAARRRAEGERTRKDLLVYQAEELRALAPASGEFEALEAQRKRLAAASDIRAAVGGHASALDDDVIPRLARAGHDLEGIDDAHPALLAGREHLQAARADAEEALAELRAYFDAVPEDVAALAAADQRLDALHDLARKHRVSPAELPRHAEQVEEALAGLNAGMARLDALQAACQAREQAYCDAASGLSALRRKAAVGFAREVGAKMAELRLNDAALEVEFAPARNERGLESARYLATTNPDFPAAALKDVASGGELARIGLAIEAVAAQRSALPCLVLDEADVGVGGATADVLGRMLRRLARRAQVICVTHAPQVAALGDTHLLVSKTETRNAAIERLDAAARLEEVARMLAGHRITGKTRDYARALLEGARAEDGAGA